MPRAAGFSDEVRAVQIAADSEEERLFLPERATLIGRRSQISEHHVYR